MRGVDRLVFSGGIGEKSPPLRQEICEGLEFLGLDLDLDANRAIGEDRIISAESSRARIAVVVMNEELVIAREAVALTG